MSLVDDRPAARRAVRLRYRLEIDQLDRLRVAGELAGEGATQREIAGLLGVSQPAVHKMLARAADAPDAPVGFSGATPLEICKRHAAGLLTREQLVAELIAFPYVQEPEGGPWDDPIVPPAGGWSEVCLADHMGLIDEEVYAEVFEGRRVPLPAQ